MLLPKGYWGLWGIVLVNVLWNTLSGILNRHLALFIVYYYFLHGFRPVQAMGSVSLEANLLHNLASVKEEVIYECLSP